MNSLTSSRILTGILVVTILSLFSCATTGTSHYLGMRRQSVEPKEVQHSRIFPKNYDLVGYVEGWHECGMFESSETSEQKAIAAMKKLAGDLGANRVVVRTTKWEKIGVDRKDDPAPLFLVVSGWALHVPGGELSEGRKEPDFKVYVQLPEKYEEVGEVVTRAKCEDVERHRFTDTKSQAFGRALEECMRKAEIMGGNGLYIRSVMRKHEIIEAGIIESTILNILDLDPDETTEVKMHYVIYGTSIRVPKGNE